MASEASYVYIWSGQKFIKKCQNSQFEEFFEKLKLAVKTVTLGILTKNRVFRVFTPTEVELFSNESFSHK